MNKKSLYLSLFVVIIVLAIYFYQFAEINRSLNEKQFTFNIPKVKVIKVNNLNDSDLINASYVWGSQQVGSAVLQNNNLSKIELKGYIYKKINGIPSICRVTNTNYRWEFYGVAYRDNGSLAVFYNPSLNKVRLAGSDEELDKDLTIEKIGSDNVYVKYKKKIFVLKVFNFEKIKKKKK